MKRLPVILFLILLGFQQTFAQVDLKLETFREKVLPRYSMYFNLAEQTENGQLSLSALEPYTGLSVDGKKEIMINIAAAWKDSLVLVHYGSKRELWGWSSETGDTRLLDELDVNAPPVVKKAAELPPSYPWFVYLGGQIGGDNQHNVNIALNLRVGFYLLANRWDFATTISGGLTGNTNFTPSGWANLGLMSRVHFPIKKIRLSPNVGGQVSMAVFGNSPFTVSGAVVLGVSWFVGIGNLDIGVSIGNVVTGMGGYTMSPRFKSNR